MRNEMQKEAFGYVFKMANTLQTYLDNVLKESEVTSKQLLMMIVIGSFEEGHPTLKDVADKWGTSYQNVKQIANKLEREGLIEITENPLDKRSKCLILSSKAELFWSNRDHEDNNRMNAIFEVLSTDELQQYLEISNKLLQRMENL